MLFYFLYATVIMTAGSVEHPSPEEAPNAAFDEAMQIRSKFNGPDPPSLKIQQHAMGLLVQLSGLGFVAPIGKATSNLSQHARDVTKHLNAIVLMGHHVQSGGNKRSEMDARIFSTSDLEQDERPIMELPEDYVLVWVSTKHPRAVRELGKAFRVSLLSLKQSTGHGYRLCRP